MSSAQQLKAIERPLNEPEKARDDGFMKINYFLSLLLLTGCTTAVSLKNPKTNDIVECGPYYTGLASDFKLTGIAARESQCIQDYKEQGYIRIPNPK